MALGNRVVIEVVGRRYFDDTSTKGRINIAIGNDGNGFVTQG